MGEKLALVTGGSRGIGRACAMELAKAGYDVIINYAGNTEAANKTVEEIKALGVNSE
ncbi:SDR family NAD(P)-dependent oxidoreductase, partial [bacterium]|nr:SDR family NAD(P)-dependent oxidoreductase [bacterium]